MYVVYRNEYLVGTLNPVLCIPLFITPVKYRKTRKVSTTARGRHHLFADHLSQLDSRRFSRKLICDRCRFLFSRSSSPQYAFARDECVETIGLSSGTATPSGRRPKHESTFRNTSNCFKPISPRVVVKPFSLALALFVDHDIYILNTEYRLAVTMATIHYVIFDWEMCISESVYLPRNE